MSDFETRWRALVSGETRGAKAELSRAGLRTLSVLYEGGVRAYRAVYDLGLIRPEALPCTVVSIGNLTVGGTGKSTTVRWMARRLREWGTRPAILSYGYRARGGDEPGGKSRVTVVAGPEGVRVPVAQSGDEPQMLARALPGVPVLTGRKRVLSGRRAWEEFQPDVLLLDDAFQYWRLQKDLEIVLVNAENPFGYERTLPGGMLREPPSALRRADAVLVTHAETVEPRVREKLRKRLVELKPGLVMAECVHEPKSLREHGSGAALPAETLRSKGWLAVSSLGQPESFERTLRELGADGGAAQRFPDHHPYTEADLALLRKRVRDERLAGIVTTEKDAVKIPPDWLGGIRCLIVEVDLRFLAGQDQLESLLRERVTRPHRQPNA